MGLVVYGWVDGDVDVNRVISQSRGASESTWPLQSADQSVVSIMRAVCLHIIKFT